MSKSLRKNEHPRLPLDGKLSADFPFCIIAYAVAAMEESNTRTARIFYRQQHFIISHAALTDSFGTLNGSQSYFLRIQEHLEKMSLAVDRLIDLSL